ncbi:MAG: OB-fold domain-containing protein [Desulfobacteraceae bacterium]|nr:OB-fold domain-containing protein [Desulfobacteraceae bacterium]
MNTQTKRILVREGLYTNPSNPEEKPALMGCRCPSCGEMFFPRLLLCQNCQDRNVEEITLSRKGRIYSFTVVMQPPASHYKGPVPYAFGWVELPEGIRVETLYTGCTLDELHIGMEMGLVIEKLHDDDEGNEVVCHKFKPVRE